jgi:LPS sulfotransferase NodH
VKRVIFCATPRTGSTMIFDDFRNALGHWPADSEILYQEIINKRTGLDWPTLWRDIQESLSAGPVWAVKVMFHYLPYLAQFISGSTLTKTPPIRQFQPSQVASFVKFFGDATWVHIRRRDVFAQAVSMYMAETTDVWEDRTGKGAMLRQDRPVYDRSRLLIYAEDLFKEREQWPELFAHFGIDQLSIDYEDAAANYPDYLSPLFSKLNLQPVSSVPPRRMFKIGDALNEDFARRLERDYQARL